jgi:hypothetical protein
MQNLSRVVMLINRYTVSTITQTAIPCPSLSFSQRISSSVTCRAAAATSAAAGAAGPGPVFVGPPSFTLEASVGTADQLDLDLLATGAFGAEVHPDLPIATTWHGLYKQISSRLQGKARRDALAAAAKAQSKAAAVQLMADIASCEEAMESQVGCCCCSCH